MHKFLLFRLFILLPFLLVLTAIQDKSVSVRKRVVKLMRDICSQQPNNAFVSSISKALVGRINDEDTIKVQRSTIK